MRPSKGLQKLLVNFMFRDCRLESQPKLLASHVYFASDESHLDLVATASKTAMPFEEYRIDIDHSHSGYALRKKEAVFIVTFRQACVKSISLPC